MKGFSVKSPRDWELDDRREGCTRNIPLGCSSNESTTGLTDKFFPIPSVRLPYDAHSISMETVASAHECIQVCLRNCSCTAYSHGRSGCSVWHEQLINVKQYNGTSNTNEEIFYHRLAAAEVPSWGQNRREKIIAVVVGASVSAFSFLAFLLLLMIWSKRRSRDYPINKIKEGDIRMLVYEHMVNRSLDAHLFCNDGTILNWSTRYQIAVGVAKGLSYLHESCHDCIIHCDIKPINILIDVSFVPKVANFGMAKLLGRDFSRVLTTMRGTVGYLVPEWISGVAITQKVDVYSYGMVTVGNHIKECKSSADQTVYFSVQAARNLLKGDVGSLVDHQLQGDINMEEVERACKVACWCIQDEDFNRPTMGDVVQVLEGLVEPGMPQVTRLLESILGDVQEFKFDQISGISTE
ncbi:hypothetical protein OsI_14783 [Oryza sativa Indica Group]|uniref:Uncharacterized protein n=1 Tax=Oryza sativa subsp. indica TaxID=39946 RepID=B8AUZ5_ORYSI|nr:hypothetical protein OsI_14783 [Oryza sativa Indica Group]